MKTEIQIGITDYTALVFIPDPASTTGAGKTGLVAANLTVSYTRVETDNDVVLTDVTSSLSDLSTLTDAHTDWGLKQVSSTLAPGLYRLDIADAVFASGAWVGVVQVQITSGLAAVSPMEFVLRPYNPNDGVRLGLTSLPNAAAEASGGLATLSAAQASNGTLNVNVHRWLTGAPNALTSGRVEVLLGAVSVGVIAAASFAANALDAVWATATRVLTAATNLTTALATPTNITGGVITTVTNLTNAPTSGDLTATMKASVTTAAASAGFSTLDAAGVRAAIGLATSNLDTQLNALPTNAELATALTAFAETAITEAYAADGAAPTRDQALMMILRMATSIVITENVNGTSTLTVKKLDGTTTAMTFTLNGDSDTPPTSRTRAT